MYTLYNSKKMFSITSYFWQQADYISTASCIVCITCMWQINNLNWIYGVTHNKKHSIVIIVINIYDCTVNSLKSLIFMLLNISINRLDNLVYTFCLVNSWAKHFSTGNGSQKHAYLSEPLGHTAKCCFCINAL